MSTKLKVSHSFRPSSGTKLVFLCKMLNFLLSKTDKNVTPRAVILSLNMHQIVCRLGLCPRPHWRSLQRSPDPRLNE